MADAKRPLTPEDAPDPAHGYGREEPKAEAGLGSLDTNRNATPRNAPNHIADAVKNQQPLRQINADDAEDSRLARDPAAGRDAPDHSMKDDIPLGWDQAPLDINNPRAKRQPKTEGKGGTP